ncbi:predicted protein [Naegleria gruberi]|uniref:Predicted protein n=1 Tax=Naegleria gruberi TaxID=5762 RepID=D2UY39_NAEGR|nr:uncharacterized protein NAEGRDRAFT_61335 [Naegleria gruberi]EFC50726.1 predicted protein [Naegleria gruberi]|eukprot:XP_002683470.1 predicted protein [Naegleria gruberi strain NEG-M]
MNTNQRGLSWLSDLSNQPSNNTSIQTNGNLISSSLKTYSPSNNTNNHLNNFHHNLNSSDLVNTGSSSSNNNSAFGEDLDDTKSTVSNESNSSRFSSISGHSSTRKDNLQKLLMTTTSSNRYSDMSQSSTSIDSSALSWDEMQNVLKTGSAEKEMEQMKDKIEQLQKNNLTLSQSLYSTNKEHLLLMNTLKEKIHEVFPNILVENQKLKDQVKDLTNYVMNLEKQIEKLRCENEHSKLILENKITELRKEIEGLKTKTSTSNKNDRIDELITASIKPIEQTLRNNNITIKRCSDDSYQLGQFKLNVNLEKKGDSEIVQVLLKDKTVPFDDFLKTFCNKFVMK